MENLGRVNPNSRGFQELYRLDDGRYVIVSTTDLTAAFAEADNLGRFAAFMCHVLGDYAIEGEETAAFLADKDGRYRTGESDTVAMANGNGSREVVLKELGGID